MGEFEKSSLAINGKVRKPVVSVDDLSVINEPNARLLSEILRKLQTEGKVLIIIDENTAKNANLFAAAENLPDVSIKLINDLNSKDVMPADYLVITKAALKETAERLSK